MTLQSSAEMPLSEFMAGYARLKRRSVKPIQHLAVVIAKATPMTVFESILTLRPLVPIEASSEINIRDAVLAVFGFELPECISYRRLRRLARARQCFAWLCRKNTKLSYPQIGRLMGDRDHSTAIYAERQFHKFESEFQNELRWISDYLHGPETSKPSAKRA